VKIRTRLTILFTLVTAAILLAFAAVIYHAAKADRENEFYALLRKEAVTKANLFLNAGVDRQTLQDIYHSNRKTLDEVEVAIYDTSFALLYHDAAEIDFVKETRQMVDEIRQKGAIGFYQGDWQVVGLRHESRGGTFIVTAAAVDRHGYNKLDSLLRAIAAVFAVSVLFIYAAGRFFSARAFRPVREMSRRAADISATNLDLRLPGKGNKDELSELAGTFNAMLDRLENSFDAQKRFVSNISHELRTPLAAITAELELSAGKDRTAAEYKNALAHALADAKKMARLSNNLLDLAKASYDPSEIAFRPVRIDETLLDARAQAQKADPRYSMAIRFEDDFEDEGRISVHGNEYLLKTAFANLFENGCKFSEDRKCAVSVSLAAEKITLRFADRGIGIAREDMERIFAPFYRGGNGTFAEGNGIGLSLVQKIIALHKGTIAVSSEENRGTTFVVELPPAVPPFQ